MKKAIFLDRDGTLIEDKSYEYATIENCVAYATFILQFSICLTARQCHLTNAVIHNSLKIYQGVIEGLKLLKKD